MSNRYVGDYPVIGIRPTIDGRRGPLKVRESLEAQTMGMAKAAAALFRENLRYTNGEPVQVVLADTTIGRVAEAAACEDKFRKAGVAITLTVTPCWCYGSETMDMDKNTIKGVWGFNGTERPGAVYLASVLASHAQKGLPAFGIYGRDVQDADETEIPDDVKEKLLRFGRAAVAAATMRGKSYLQIGSICMGIAGSIINPDFFEEYLGMRVESVDEVEILRRMEEGIYDEAEFQKALAWAKANCKEGFDKNPDWFKKTDAQKEEAWEFVVKMMCIIKDLYAGNPNLPEGREEEAVGHNALCGGNRYTYSGRTIIRTAISPKRCSTRRLTGTARANRMCSQRKTTRSTASPCCLVNCLRIPRRCSPTCARSGAPRRSKKAAGYTLTGKAAEAGGFIHLINSGASCLDFCGAVKDANGNGVVKPFWEMTEADCKACLDATTWNAADMGYFRGGGFSSRFLTRSEMPATMCRLNIVKGLGPVMQIAEGYTVALPDEVSDKLWKRTDYTWPCTWFAPRLTGKGAFKSAYDVMNNWGANHGAISYGHIGADLITLCSILRIPVCMHNVPEEKIFRPAVWNAFGMDKEGQDFRACAAFGPMYK